MRIRELQKALEETIFAGQAHRAGVFTELHKQPDTAAGLAKRMAFDERCTFVLLEALVEMGYLTSDSGTYRVTKDTFDRLVDSQGDEYEGDFWSFLLYLVNPWQSLPYVLKHGEPNKSSYKDFSMKDFIEGMNSPWKKKIAPEIVDICIRCHGRDPKVVADIGGAPGTMSLEFVRRGMKAIVFDLPESLAVTKDRLSKVKGIEVVGGDATKELPDGKYDIAFLGNICHGQSPEDNEKIIRMCYEHLNGDGIVVVFDNLRGESYLGATVALHMIVQSPRGDIYTRAQYAEWLTKAGFTNIAVEQISDKAWQLMIGYKQGR